jgi:hypothetical protein
MCSAKAKPPRRRHRRELRSAVGHHPPHPACGPRGSYRPEGRGRFSATRLSRPMASSASSNSARACPQRLSENAEVVGTDETFFRGRKARHRHPRPFHRKIRHPGRPGGRRSGPRLAGLSDLEKRLRHRSVAEKDHPRSARRRFLHQSPVRHPRQARLAPPAPQPTGVMVYVRTADGNDALAWVDEEGRTVTESQHEILRAAACDRPHPRSASGQSSSAGPKSRGGIQTEQITTGGQLGKPSSARRRVV